MRASFAKLLNCLILVSKMLSDESTLKDPMADLEPVVAAPNGVAFFESGKGGKIAVYQSYM